MKSIKDNKSDDNEKPLKHKKNFDELFNERIEEMYNISKQIDFNNLTYYFRDETISPINFISFRGPMYIYNNIRNGNISIGEIEEDQKHFQSNLNEIAENPKYKSKVQLNTIENIRNLYNSREKVINLYNNYEIRSEVMYKRKQRTVLKILTPKEMLQRLTIPLAQVKAGNYLESSLNEIRQIVYSLYQLKEITKKVHSNITKSIQVKV